MANGMRDGRRTESIDVGLDAPMDTPNVSKPPRALKRPPPGTSVDGSGLNSAADYDLLPDLVGFWVRRAHVKVLRSFERHLAAYHVTPTEVAALIIIGANQALSQIALASALGTDQSTVVNLLLGLEQRALISRVRLPTDRRYQILSLTPAGRKALRGIKAALARHNESLQAAFSVKERKALLALLQRFVGQ